MNERQLVDPEPEITVETRILGWSAERIRMPAPAGTLSVADLIRLKITTEWSSLQRGERADVGRESLPPEQLGHRDQAHQLPEQLGYASRERLSREQVGRPAEPMPPASLEEAVRTAMDGYRSGWYIILVDGEEPGGLDTRLQVSPDTRIAFVRIYPLPDASSNTP